MHWFIDPIKNKYADFTGRATRQEYWMFVLYYVLTYIVLTLIVVIIKFPFLLPIYLLGLLVPQIAIVARRLHDIGKSGWWQLIGLIPVVGPVVMLVFLVLDSQPGTNQYGPNLKGVDGESAPAQSEVSEQAPEATVSPADSSENDV